MTDKRLNILIPLLLLLATLAVYHGVRSQEFVLYDDAGYVYQNPSVRGGLTTQGFRYAFTSVEEGYWQPVTFLSHMLDCQLLGVDAGRQKMVNVLMHAANAVLLWLLLRQATGATWRSAAVAMLFAVHPLNVESVAWVAERKNVLSTMLGLLTIMAYIHYARRPEWWRYLLVVVLYALCLMAKPMLVTMPFLLLLLDFWPLRRWADDTALAKSTLKKCLVDKVPLLALAVADCVVTMVSAGRVTAMWMGDHVTLTNRVVNAVVSYGRYVLKMVWPMDMVCIYPFPASWPAGVFAIAVLFVVAVTVVAIALSRKRPMVLVGWFWFLGTLLPAIGIVASGPQAMADRYAYFPMIGLFIAIIFAIPERLNIATRASITAFIVAAVLALAFVAQIQVRYWQNSETLFTHALRHTSDNFVAESSLATDYDNRHLPELAETHFLRALHINPRYPFANANYGFLLLARGDAEHAADRFAQATKVLPQFANAQLGLAQALDMKGDWPAAQTHFQQAVALRPEAARYSAFFGMALLNHGDIPGALAALEHAERCEPDQPEVQYFLGAALERAGREAEALGRYRLASLLHPGYTEAEDAVKRLGEKQRK